MGANFIQTTTGCVHNYLSFWFTIQTEENYNSRGWFWEIAVIFASLFLQPLLYCTCPHTHGLFTYIKNIYCSSTKELHNSPKESITKVYIFGDKFTVRLEICTSLHAVGTDTKSRRKKGLYTLFICTYSTWEHAHSGLVSEKAGWSSFHNTSPFCLNKISAARSNHVLIQQNPKLVI